MKLHGPLWALAALGAGLAGPKLLERAAPAPEPEPARFEREPEAEQVSAAA